MLYNTQSTMHHHLYHTFGYHQLCIINRIILGVVRRRMLYNIQASMHHGLYHTFGLLCIYANMCHNLHHSVVIRKYHIHMTLTIDPGPAGQRALTIDPEPVGRRASGPAARHLLALLGLLVVVVARGEPREPAPEQ